MIEARPRHPLAHEEQELLTSDPLSREILPQLYRELKAALRQRGFGDWAIYLARVSPVIDAIVRNPRRYGEKSLIWEPFDLEGIRQYPDFFDFDRDQSRREPSFLFGSEFLHLPASRVVFARWPWVARSALVSEGAFTLIAAPDKDVLEKLLQKFHRVQKRLARKYWVIHTLHVEEREIRNFGLSLDDLTLDKEILNRLEGDVISFFNPAMKKRYATLEIPYRRGVLLYGPPGNGKTSIIRSLGSMLRNVSANLIKFSIKWDNEDLERVLTECANLGPAMLVLEDIDTLFDRTSITTSEFLNLMDGLFHKHTQGMLIIATTNHPERLNPALNNRPGRFDVLLEIPSPDANLRQQYLSRLLPETPPQTLAKLVTISEQFSFSHLREVANLAGYLAVQRNENTLTDMDLIRAAKLVRGTIRQVVSDFTSDDQRSFGFASMNGHSDTVG